MTIPGRAAVGYSARMLRRLVVPLSLVLVATPAARAQTVPTGFAVETLAPGLSTPVAFEFLPDGRVLFVEQFTGRVRVFTPGAGVQATPVLAVPGVAAGGERGLLGIAVDPAFPTRPYVYVFHDVATPRHIRIARFTLAGDLAGTGASDLVADPASRHDLIDDIPDQADNHNGGTVRFGIEGVLYASVGEDAVACAAQAPGTLRGVILRLRTDLLPPGPGSAFRAQLTLPDNPFAASADSNLRLVGAYGLRNPFRFQVDPKFGTLVIGDVGGVLREELDMLQPPLVFANLEPPPAEAAPLGANFGWPWREGTAVGTLGAGCGPEPVGLVAPLFEYDRTARLGGAAIVSAGRYRHVNGLSTSWPLEYDGDVFANDYYSGELLRLKPANGVWGPAPPVPGQPSPTAWGVGFNEVSDWRVGPDGALWFCRQSVDFAPNSGSIARILGLSSPPPPAVPALRVSLRVSPAVGSAVLLVSDDAAPARLTIHDAFGRAVRTFHSSEFLRGASGIEVRWDGLDHDGRRMRPGACVARLESAGRTASTRIPFLR